MFAALATINAQYLAPTLTSQQSNIYRSPYNLGQVSHQSKTIDTPFSSVSKSDVRVSNPGALQRFSALKNNILLFYSKNKKKPLKYLKLETNQSYWNAIFQEFTHHHTVTPLQPTLPQPSLMLDTQHFHHTHAQHTHHHTHVQLLLLLPQALLFWVCSIHFRQISK